MTTTRYRTGEVRTKYAAQVNNMKRGSKRDSAKVGSKIQRITLVKSPKKGSRSHTKRKTTKHVTKR